MPVSGMTNLSPDDTWKMKIFDAPCRERSIKMARVVQQAWRGRVQAMTALSGLFMSLCYVTVCWCCWEIPGRGHGEKCPWLGCPGRIAGSHLRPPTLQDLPWHCDCSSSKYFIPGPNQSLCGQGWKIRSNREGRLKKKLGREEIRAAHAVRAARTVPTCPWVGVRCYCRLWPLGLGDSCLMPSSTLSRS